jgi:ATP-dependent Lon protease
MKAEKKRCPSSVGPAATERFLGPPQFFNLEAERQNEIGVATAVAWTENGGEIMPVEVLLTEGKGNLQITGQIGNIMQESAQAAFTFLKSRARQVGIEPELFEEVDIHIHIPEGAIPKDGPSAGITICTALFSAFTGSEVLRDVGMTGEITLRGRVLPVGGVREKVLAAHRAGLKTVILPKRNIKDLVDVPKRARSEINIVPIEHMDQVLAVALVPASHKAKSVRPKRKDVAQDTAQEGAAASGEAPPVKGSGASLPVPPAA